MKKTKTIRLPFASKYKKLLLQIKDAYNNKSQLCLPNNVWLDFRPGHEYDKGCLDALPRLYDGKNFIDKYLGHIGQVVHMTVYDCFEGDVKILAVGEDRVFIEIVDVLTCYSCQKAHKPGEKYWIADWEIPPEFESAATASETESNSFPF